MTAANVTFLNLAHEPIEGDAKPARFAFDCVGFNRGRDSRLPRERCAGLFIAEGPHSEAHGLKRDGTGKAGAPMWNWDGNREAPTFTPSIHCGQVCGWHGYITNGRCVDTNGRDEHE